MIQDFTLEYVSELIQQRYGMKGKLKQLGSYLDKNFLLNISEEGKNEKFIVKISSSLESQPRIELQNYVLKQLENQRFNFKWKFPKIILATNGNDMFTVTSNDGTNIIRILSYIEGDEICDLQHPPLHLFDQSGELAAHLNIFLSQLSTSEKVAGLLPSNSVTDYTFNLMAFNQHFQKHHKCLDSSVLLAVHRIKQQFNQILPILQTFPEQLVHHDICLTNLLVAKSQQNGELFISGLIDFSDMVYTYGIMELVVLCARINLYQPQPLRNMLRVIQAFNRVIKLTQNEKKVLFPLIKARLAVLCLISSGLAAEKVNDSYFQKCKNGQIMYLMTFANICTNSQFIQLVEAQILAL